MNAEIFFPLRRAIWRARRAIAQAVMPRQAPETARGRQTSQPSDSLATRTQAGELWESGDVGQSLDLLRRQLLKQPWDSLLWMSYGYRLQSLSRYSEAYECFINAVEIDPGNFGALEHFVEMALSRNETHRLNRILSRLPTALVDRPHRHVDSLYFAVPYGITEAVEVVAEGGCAIAQAVVELQRQGKIAVELSDSDSQLAIAVFNLCNDDRSGAVQSVSKLEPDQLPLLGIRLAIRRAMRESDPNASLLLAEYLRASPNDRWAQQQLERLERSSNLDMSDSSHHLLKTGFPVPPERTTPPATVDRAQIVYAVHNSLPYHSTGYSTRTHGLLSALRHQGWRVDAASRPGYPTDLQGFKTLSNVQEMTYVEGVAYHRLGTRSGQIPKRPIVPYIQRYTEELAAFAQDRRAALVHGASNHLNGLAAVSAARRLGLPSIYEVRGLWEVTRASRDPMWAASMEYRLAAELETEAAAAASHVIALTDALKAELVNRGVDAEKISVVPNGVDTTRFRPMTRDSSLARELGIGSETVIGYVGSIVDYEGLGLLVEAAARLSEERSDFVVLIVGDGAEYENLKTQVRLLGIDSFFRFVGRVPHNQVEKYYSIVDITPFPRLSVPVCEMVSPLKPFEAMAMGKVVVASDVAAMAEIVSDGTTGLLHRKNDASSLADSLRCVMDDDRLRTDLSEKARSWVEDERRWDVLGARVGRIYESLGGLRTR